MPKVRFFALVALVCALALPAAAHAATTWTVDSGAASDCSGTTCKTIQGAVDHAAAGDTINVHPGAYIQAVSIGKSVAINGGPGVIVTASGGTPLTVSGANVTLSGLGVLSNGAPALRITATGATVTGSTLVASGADTVQVESSSSADLTIKSSVLTGTGASNAALVATADGLTGHVTVTASHVTTAGLKYGASAVAPGVATLLATSNATINVDNSIVHGTTAAKNEAPCALGCTAKVNFDAASDTTSSDSSLFVNPAGFNLHLKRGASAIDHGTDSGTGQTDVDGQPRKIGAATDLGADEYDDITATTPALTATPATAAPAQAVAFQVSASPAPPTLGVDHYVVNFGDGSPAATTTGAASHAYASPGTYHATAVAVGKSGAVSPAATATVTVAGGGIGNGGNSSGACSGGFTQPNGAPTISISAPRSGKVLKLKKTIRRHHRKVKVLNPPSIRGVACDTDGVRSVQLAVLYLGKKRTVNLGGTCKAFDGRRSFKSVACARSRFFSARISDFDWRFKFSSKSKLKAGYYAVFARATDDKGNTSAVLSKQARTLSVFRLK
jgi:PKD domain